MDNLLKMFVTDGNYCVLLQKTAKLINNIGLLLIRPKTSYLKMIYFCVILSLFENVHKMIHLLYKS